MKIAVSKNVTIIYMSTWTVMCRLSHLKTTHFPYFLIEQDIISQLRSVKLYLVLLQVFHDYCFLFYIVNKIENGKGEFVKEKTCEFMKLIFVCFKRTISYC